jgi:hypothetical protein
MGKSGTDRGRHVLRATAHTALRAFIAVFRAVRGFLRAAAASFLALTTDGNSNLGCAMVAMVKRLDAGSFLFLPQLSISIFLALFFKVRRNRFSCHGQSVAELAPSRLSYLALYHQSVTSAEKRGPPGTGTPNARLTHEIYFSNTFSNCPTFFSTLPVFLSPSPSASKLGHYAASFRSTIIGTGTSSSNKER